MGQAALCITANLLLAALLSSCAGGNARQNLADWMQDQVGKHADDPNTYRSRYGRFRLGTVALANGNTEEEFRAGRADCRVFFEIDRSTRKIIAWRYGQPDNNCVLVP
jgi:hypothetical protein